MYKTVIGLEVHCEVLTKSKNFSESANTYTINPNIHVNPVDLGLPGILPYPNKEAVRKALKTAIALHCETPDEVIFDRKNYYYPDLPKGYQITQMSKPCGRNGYLDIFVGDSVKRVYIHQLHLEEDTASLEHFSNYSLIDYNRSGIPLMEIVTEPCISSSEEAVIFLETLRNVFLYLGVSEAKSDKGQMRCDVNISLMKEDDKVLGTKVEMKNINAFTSVRDAIEYEIKRQSEILDRGEKVIQETRRIDSCGKTCAMREKVDAVDYKYFIEPNIPPVKLDEEYIKEIKSEIPLLETERINKYVNEYHLSFYDASVLTKDKSIADYYEEVLEYTNSFQEACKWVTSVVLATLKKKEITLDEFFITPRMLGGVINYVLEGKISMDNAKKIIYEAVKLSKDPLEIIHENNISQIDDNDKLRPIVLKVINDNPKQIAEYLEGKDYVINYFMGHVMKETNRQASPNVTKELIISILKEKKDE